MAHLLKLGCQFFMYPYYLERGYLKNYSFCSYKANKCFALPTDKVLTKLKQLLGRLSFRLSFYVPLRTLCFRISWQLSLCLPYF